jgi:hypothetical protein
LLILLRPHRRSRSWFKCLRINWMQHFKQARKCRFRPDCVT